MLNPALCSGRPRFRVKLTLMSSDLSGREVSETDDGSFVKCSDFFGQPCE